MNDRLNRRDFLLLGAASGAGLAFRPPPPNAGRSLTLLARVATTWIWIYSEPSTRSPRLGRLNRDELLTPMERIRSDDGPSHNPTWFQIPGGYAHSGNLQLVRWLPQAPQMEIPAGGGLFEVSVPYTRTYRKPDQRSGPLYRLYFQSTHWVEKAVVDQERRVWYQILDDVLYLRYFARAEHLRQVTPEEFSPISPYLPARLKRIEVSLRRQELTAYEEDRLVFRTRISSGIPDSRPRENGIPTITPDGVFRISKKTPMRHMGDGRITADLEAYELPGVPWVSFFHETGVAFHGTYWHTDFGIPRSHGCVNMRPEEARWLYRWTMPAAAAGDRLRIGRGTSVVVS